MSDKSRIEWTDITWNFITGCTKISDGCLNCYIERTMPFRTARRHFDKPGIGGASGVTLHPDRLLWPLEKWRKPSLIFVNSLADIFHEDVPDEFIARAFAVMAQTPQHIYQVLTKRHARMRSLLNRVGPEWSAFTGTWPLPNVWLGVSVESQQWANIRIPALVETPAAVRWISCEPLLGPVDLGIDDPHASHESDDVNGYPHPRICLTCSTDDENEVEYFRREPGGGGPDWVVVGGESGPRARPMDLEWAESLVRQCQFAGVPAFVKQLGSRWGKQHHDIDLFPEALRVREYPEVSR